MWHRFYGLKRVTIVFLCIVILCFISIYWILSSTLLSHDFYSKILTSKALSTFNNAYSVMSEKGMVVMSQQSMGSNILSLIDGVIRYITQNDMSLSDVAIEYDKISSTTLLSESTNNVLELPEISRIHPYAFSYFMPELGNIYSYLNLIQKGYKIYRYISPVVCFIGLLILLLSKKVTENIRVVLIITSITISAGSLILLIFQNALLVFPAANALGTPTNMIEPFIDRMTLLLFIKCMKICAIYIIIAFLSGLKPLKRFIKKSSRKIALILVITAGIFFILYGNEMINNINRTVNNPFREGQAYTLNQEEGTVHSLIIKLRDDKTNTPVADVQLILKSPDDSLFTTAYSDDFGNARFILPQGKFYLYVNESTIPAGYTPFEPTLLSLKTPGSSWYTFHLAKEQITDANLEIQTLKTSENSDLPLP